MKPIYFLAVITIFCLTSCNKSASEKSQIEREMSEPLKENEIIADGAVRVKLDYQNAEIGLEGEYVSVTQPFVNYYIESMPENSEMLLYINYNSGTGTFDLMAEGFTASTNTKRFYLRTQAIGVGKVPFMKIIKGIVKYTFIKL